MADKSESNNISIEALKVRSEIVVQCEEHCFDLTPEQVQTVIDLYKETDGKEHGKLFGSLNWGKEKKINTNGTVKIDIDCSDALTGLKAIIREAKNTAAALKELEGKREALIEKKSWRFK